MQKAAIVYLTRQKDLWMFVHSIKSLFDNFNNTYKYDVVVFHDDITATAISGTLVELHNQLGYVPNIKFEKIHFVLPEWVSSDTQKYTTDGPHPTLQQFPLGYRHMCRFYSGLIFNHPAMKPYKYYMRLDSDSFILSKIDKDPFQYMADNGYEYAAYSLGLPEEAKEIWWARLGLWETTQEFIKNNTVKFPLENWDGEVYNTNLEIVDMDFFRGSDYQNYFNHLDFTGNIFYRRWGDAPIRWLGVRMFMAENKIWCLRDGAKFSYLHGSQLGNPHLVDFESVSRLPEPFKTGALKQLTEVKTA